MANRFTRASELAAQARMWAGFERGLTLAAGRVVVRHMRRGAKGYESDGLVGMSLALEDAGQEWFRLLVPHYASTGKAFGKRTFRRLGLKSAFEEFDARLMAWVQNNGLLEAKALSETTMLMLRGLVEAGELEGLSAGAIAKLIRTNAPLIGRTRSVVIGRTETHNAASFASQEAARSTGIEMTKEWLAHPGPRTRDTHIEAGAQDPIPLDEPFMVGGYPMMYPGDSSMGAPAGEIIQCRCGEIQEVAE